MSADLLRDLVGRLGASTNALSAIGAALNAKAASAAPSLEVRAHLDEVLTALGVREAIDGLSPAAARPLLGEIRVALLHGIERVTRGALDAGWKHTEPGMLQAAGDVSAGFPALLQRIIPRLHGLASRLDVEDARFLDVGVGVAALSIEMARLWPNLRVVGLDVWAPALALARGNVKSAGLEARVELREQSVQDLTDTQAFDLAWIPSAFIPGPVIPEAVHRVHRSLRPGGWVLFATVNPSADPLALSLARLRTVEWGARPWTPTEATRVLEESGFEDVVTLPSPPAALVALVAGRVPDRRSPRRP